MDIFEQGLTAEVADNPGLLEEIAAEHADQQQRPQQQQTVVETDAKASTLDYNNLIVAVESFIATYLVLPAKALLPLACWVAATYIYETFDTFPYLSILSPVKRCGKTRLAEVLSCIALNPILTTGISEAALFRLVDKGECTLLLDEAEALREKRNERSQAIVSILNSGYRQGAFVHRCQPPKMDLVPFNVFGPKAIIAIGSLPDTVADRSIVIRMRRKKAGESLGRFLSRGARAESEPLRAALGQIASARQEDIRTVYETLPVMPELSDRDDELWQCLVAICAVLAPERVGELRESAITLSKGKAESDVDDSLPLRLLTDIAGLLSEMGERIPSEELVARLKRLPESPWAEPGRELSQN